MSEQIRLAARDALAEEERVKLEILLAELQQLKARLRTVSPSRRF